MQEEINFFLDEKPEEEKDKTSQGRNPFLALIGYYNKKPESGKKETKKEEEHKKIRQDDWIEKNHLRKLAIENSKENAFNLFDIYKQAHGMVSYT